MPETWIKLLSDSAILLFGLIAGAVIAWIRTRNRVRDDVVELRGSHKEIRREFHGFESRMAAELEERDQRLEASERRHANRMDELDKRLETQRLEIQREIKQLDAKSMTRDEVLAHLQRVDEKQDSTIATLKELREDIRLSLRDRS